MNAPGIDAASRAARQIEALADDLAGRGFAVQVMGVQVGGMLRLRVISRTEGRLSEDVCAAPARDGSWWFWWSWAERITPIDDVDAAAFKIAYVLTPAPMAEPPATVLRHGPTSA